MSKCVHISFRVLYEGPENYVFSMTKRNSFEMFWINPSVADGPGELGLDPGCEALISNN